MSRRNRASAGRAMLIAVAAALVCSFGAAQLIRPIPISPVPLRSSKLVLPPDVQAVMGRACRDCHSSETRWPWYARFAPLSWMVLTDVEKGRRFMNFSEWQTYSKPRQMAYVAAISGAATSSIMPPKRYTMLHRDARLTDGERQLISQWAMGEYKRLRQPSSSEGE